MNATDVQQHLKNRTRQMYGLCLQGSELINQPVRTQTLVIFVSLDFSVTDGPAVFFHSAVVGGTLCVPAQPGPIWALGLLVQILTVFKQHVCADSQISANLQTRRIHFLSGCKSDTALYWLSKRLPRGYRVHLVTSAHRAALLIHYCSLRMARAVRFANFRRLHCRQIRQTEEMETMVFD